MSTHSITYPDETPFTTPRPYELRPGDEVLVYDAVSCGYEWHVVMDAVERDSRQRVRIMGTNYYFDSGVVKGWRLNHHVPPARYRRPTQEINPHEDRQIDDFWGDDDEECDDYLFRLGDCVPTGVYV